MPGGVYGPGDHSSIGGVLDQAANGKLPALTFGDLGMNMAHVDDIAAGIALVGERGNVGQSYILGWGDHHRRRARPRVAAIARQRAPRLTRRPGRFARRRRSCGASVPTSARS
jgi:dihydroflavonol-4-reductase